MSLFGRAKRVATIDGVPLIPPRMGMNNRGVVNVNEDSALRHSAVWACLRLRADLVSTMPVDVFRMVVGVQVEVPKAPVLVSPGGEKWPYHHWMWATQCDLDKVGNAIGLITETDGGGRPARIDLQNSRVCSIIERRGKPLQYRIDGKVYDADKVWHEKQFPVSGMAAGLSPLAYAAWTIGEYLSLQQFALEWFGGGAVPRARLRNTEKKLSPEESRIIKERYKASQVAGDLFVHGKDWEYSMIQAEQAGMEWIEGRRFGLADVARFFGCPADLIEAAVSGGGTITYANITQRNLQFLIMQLGPAVVRRELTLSALLAKPRFVKINTKALLRMDPASQAAMNKLLIDARLLTNTEGRALDNRAPLTAAEIDEFAKIYGGPRVQPTTVTSMAGDRGDAGSATAVFDMHIQ